MENYRKIDKIGEGTYGKVYMAKDRRNGQTVALKKIQLLNVIGGIPVTLIRETALLKQIHHENIIQLLDIQSSEHNMYLIFEYLEFDLKKYMDKFNEGMSPGLVKNYMNQLLNGLKYCHSRRIIHRDLKPQNLLVSSEGIIKIADFGLSRYVGISSEAITNEVVTLWYRSPEILFGSKLYLFGIDVWSLACIFVEMAHKKVLFRGDSEIDQLFKIFRILGTPGDKSWPDIASLPHFNISFPKWLPQNLKLLLPKFNGDALDLLQEMLVYNPKSRISASDALRHEYFKEGIPQQTAGSYVTLL